MTHITCCNCGIIFAVPEHWESSRREDHQNFWCPNGHQQAFLSKSETEKLRTDLKEKVQDLAIADERTKYAWKQCDHQERRARVYKAKFYSLRNQANGKRA